MEIMVISFQLSTTHYGFKVIKLECEEMEKIYITTDNKKINKKWLLKPRTKFDHSHTKILYYTFCLVKDEQKAKDMLKRHVIKIAEDIEIEALKMFRNLKLLKRDNSC